MFTIEASSLGRIVVAPSLPPGFALFYTTLDFPGRLSDDAAATITGVVRDRFGIDASLTTCTQVHGKVARRAEHADAWRECDSCDALWSDQREVALGIKVADCLPVTMLDPAHAVVANIHSGWRGAAQQITAATLETILRETPFDPAIAHAYLGPSIRVCCFEVGEEVVEQFGESGTSFVDRTRGAKPHIDLPALTTSVLLARGFAAGRIFDSGLCTRCEGSIFHSYRRGANGGRNLAIAAQ